MINTVCTLKNLNGGKNDSVTVKNVTVKDYTDKYIDVISISYNGETVIVDVEDVMTAIDKCSSRMCGRRRLRRYGGYMRQEDESEDI